MTSRAAERYRRIGLGIAAILIPISVALAMPQSSTAEPGGEPATPPDGDRLAQLTSNDEVRDVAATVDLYKSPGYGKVTVDLGAREVHVFWKGVPPEEVSKQLGEQENGVKVTLTSTVYSAADLAAAGETLLVSGLGKGGIPVNGVSRTPDMSGLIAEILPSDLASAGAASPSSSGRSALDASLSQTAGVPVNATEGLGVSPTTRQNDSPPWQGGGALRWPALPTQYCSTGFAMLTAGSGRLLTAAHCEPTGNLEVRDGSNNAPAGVISAGGAAIDVRAAGIDSMIIDPSASPATIGKVFGGAYNQASGTAKYEYHVGGWSAPHEDDEVCVSGANSGEHCNRFIIETGYRYFCPGTSLSCTGFRYADTGAGATVATGDSGGPIYVERADGRVGARGIQSAGQTQSIVACPPVADNNPPVTCYHVAVGVGIHNIIDYWSAHGHPGLTVEFD